MNKICMIALASALLVFPAHASDDVLSIMDGNKLYEFCSSAATTPEWGQCTGYVQGAFDQTMNDQEAYGLKWICMPSRGVDTVQLRDIVIKYLRDNPDQRHYVASTTIAVALTKAFPCKHR